MKSKLIAALLVATSAALAAPAFASGYGPAPFYRPDVGAPSSQQGPSAQTLPPNEAMLPPRKAGWVEWSNRPCRSRAV